MCCSVLLHVGSGVLVFWFQSITILPPRFHIVPILIEAFVTKARKSVPLYAPVLVGSVAELSASTSSRNLLRYRRKQADVEQTALPSVAGSRSTLQDISSSGTSDSSIPELDVLAATLGFPSEDAASELEEPSVDIRIQRDEEESPNQDIPAQAVHVEPAQSLRRTIPEYPQQARAARVQGSVTLDAIISAEGDVHEIRVVSGHSLLVNAAVRCVAAWKYLPATRNGLPVSSKATIVVNFVLTSPDKL